MQTSKGIEMQITQSQRSPETITNENRPKRRKTVGKLLLLAALLVLLNTALCLVLEPYKSSSLEMWEGFHAQESLDTVYTGTSQCLLGIDPAILDAACSTRSYNMATNMQSLANSKEAIASAIREYGIQHAVLVVDHELLNTSRSENGRADQSFWHGKAVAESSVTMRIADDLRFMTSRTFFGTPSSITYLMPWVYNRTSNVKLTLQEKRAGRILDTSGHRTKKGFQPSTQELGQDADFISWEEADEWDQVAVSLQDLQISEENLRELRGIRDLCSSENVELTVIIVPYPNWLSIYRKEEYLSADARLKELFAEADDEFYDFNLILPDYYDASGNEYYSDVGHMNQKGAERFSAFLAKFLTARDQGEDVGSWFRPLPGR